MKILIILNGFFPGKKYGGPPVSVNNFCNLLKKDIYIICSDHDLGEQSRYHNINDGWNNMSNCKVLYLSDRKFNLESINRVIKEVDPDLIYLQSIFSNASLKGLIAAKQNNLKVLLAPRGELDSGAFKKKYKKIPYIALLKLSGLLKDVYIQSTSEIETESVINRLGIDRARIYELDNIPDFPQNKLNNHKKIVGSLNAIFISRIVSKKNLDFSISLLKDIQGDINYDIYGPIEDRNYWEKCKTIIKDLPKNIKVNYRGFINREDIFEKMSTYDVLLFPTKSENYGQVIAEALLSGCVPIISDQTPWSDVNMYNAGWSIPLNQKEEYIQIVNNLARMDNKEFERIRANINAYLTKKINLDNIKKDYNYVFSEIVNEN